MVERKETVDEPSLFNEAVDLLSRGEVYENEFNPKQTAKLMSGFVDEVIKKRKEDASLRTMEVDIEENRGTISGTIIAKSYPNDIINMICVLINDDKNLGLLKLSKLKITSDSRLARWALSALRIEKNTKNDLQNPDVQNPNVNVAFMNFLNSRLNKKGVEATKLYLQFKEEGLLAVKISGGLIAPRR